MKGHKLPNGLRIAGVFAVLGIFIGIGFLFWKKGDLNVPGSGTGNEESVQNSPDIGIGSGTESEESDEAVSYEEGVYPLKEALFAASGYDAIYEGFAGYYKEMYQAGATAIVDDGTVGPNVPTTSGQALTFTEVADYENSDGDVYKTAGTYAYLIKNDNTLCVADLKNDQMQSIAVLSGTTYDQEYISEVHVYDNKLVMITGYGAASDTEPAAYRDGTMVYLYEMTEAGQPILLDCVDLEGYYLGSGLKESNLYVYTSCHKDGFIGMDGMLIPAEELTPSDYVPMVNGEVLAPEQIYMPKKISDNGYFMTAGWNLMSLEKEFKAFLSVDTDYYAGENSIILTLKNGLYHIASTVLIRAELSEGTVIPTAAGAVTGNLIGGASVSEQDGFLRVVSSIEDGDAFKNTLYVFDEAFGILAKKDDLAGGGLIRSARFTKEELFLSVAAKEPILTVDLSDVKKIKKAKENQMVQPEGFEGLLYEFGENRMIGLSYILNEETLAYEGLKLSVFDTSDLADVKVADAIAIQTDTTPAIKLPQAFYLDQEKGIVGFPTEDWNEGYTKVENIYHLYQYLPDTGFVPLLQLELGNDNCWYARGFAVGDVFCVAEQSRSYIRSFDTLNGYAQTGELSY